MTEQIQSGPISLPNLPTSPPRPWLRLRDLEELELYEEERNAAGEREDLDRWLALIPKIPSLRPYRASFRAVDDYFQEVELEGEELHLWRAYKEVIMQRLTGVYDDILHLTDIILQDLFYFFVRHERLQGVKSRYTKRVVPLTFLGRSEDYYYTYAGDQALPVVVVSIPQSRVGSVWNWLAIPHEVGHHILAHFPGYEEELLSAVATALRPLRLKVTQRHYPYGISNKALLATIWYFWLEEMVADLFGILFTGPAHVMARQEDALRLVESGIPVHSSTLDVKQTGMSRYPTTYVRGLFQTETLRYLGFADWADSLDRRWRKRFGRQDQLYWFDDSAAPFGDRTPLLSVPTVEMLRAFRAMLPAMIDTPVAAFGGNRLLDLIRYDADDHERVLRVAEGLLNGTTKFGRKDRARHILAASRFAFEREPGQQESIHELAVEAIKYCEQWVK